MKKLTKSLLISAFALMLFAGSVFAANSTSIRLQQPASPTNKDSFNITFVALDTNPNQTVSVQCYKKGPSDGAFSAFGSQINLSNGGNTDNCKVTSGVMNQGAGTYQFYAKVVTGSSTPDSSIVSVNFNNSGPDTPSYNGKDKNACVITVKFRTANDNGKTSKVEIYRSTNTSFDANSGTRIATVNVGSNTDKTYNDNVAGNCDTTYYYAIRAFDEFGNGSGVVGDTTTVTTSSANPTTTPQGAILVSDVGDTITSGEGSEVSETQPSEGVLGTESESGDVAGADDEQKTSVASSIFSNMGLWLLALGVLIVLGLYIYRRYTR